MEHVCSYHNTYQETLPGKVLCGICREPLGEVELLRYKLECLESQYSSIRGDLERAIARIALRNRQIRDLRRQLRKTS